MSNTTSRGRGGMGDRYLAEPLEQRQLLTAPPLSATIESFNFDSTAAASTAYPALPDANIAVGPNHVLNVVTTAIQWYTKPGTLQNTQRLGKNESGSTTGSFFASLSPNSVVDQVRAVYDPHGGRFLVLGRDNAPGTSRMLVAVSDNADPNGTWYYTAINSKLTVLGQECVANWPGLAFGDQGVYVTAGMFTSTGASFGTAVWPINKTPWYSGGAASVTGPLLTQAAAALYQPVQMFDNSFIDMFICNYAGYSATTGEEVIDILGISNPFTAPTFFFGGATFVDNIDDQTVLVPAAPQMGTSTAIYAGDRRLQSPIFKNGAFWASNTVVPFNGPDANTATVHWYKYHSGIVYDHGSIGGEDIAPGTHTFFPSIMVDDEGDMAVTFSASGPSIHPGAYYTTRLASDPAGTTQPSLPLAAGVDQYVRDLGAGNQWGLHSSIASDPSDNNAIWMYNQYAMARGLPGAGSGDGRWATRNGKIVLGPPGGISGTCYWDHDFSGTRNVGVEFGLAGATVWVDFDNDGTIDSGEPTTTSAGDGSYSFSGLWAGIYNVRYIVPAGYLAISNPRVVTVVSNLFTVDTDLPAIATVYTGTAGNDNYLLRPKFGNLYDLFLNGSTLYVVPGFIPSLVFNLGGGTDTLTIDETGTVASVTFTATAGTIQHGFVPITHTGVESISLVGGTAADTFNITTAALQPVTVDGGPAADTYNAINTQSSALVVVNGAGGDVLNVNTDNTGSARVDVNNSVTLGAVNVGNLGLINVNGPGTTVLRTSTLSMTAQARIDLNINNMIVDYTGGSPLATIQSLLTSGYAGGGWGGFGIRTSDAFAGSTTSLGYAEATSLFSTFPATFAGQQVDNTSILIRYTLYGDTNLDRGVDVADLGILASNWQQSPRTFAQGDFNYDGSVDVADLGFLATNWQSSSSAAAAPAQPSFLAARRLASRLFDGLL